jgi:hypothetical protein
MFTPWGQGKHFSACIAIGQLLWQRKIYEDDHHGV